MVTGDPRPFDEAVLPVEDSEKRMCELDLKGNYDHGPDDEEDRREWVVPVRWEKAVPRAQAFWKRSLFANQNPACRLRAIYTIDEVSRHFGIE
jgi:hypothetical protein